MPLRARASVASLVTLGLTAGCSNDYQSFGVVPPGTAAAGGAGGATSSSTMTTTTGASSASTGVGGNMGNGGTAGAGGGATPGMVLVPAGPFEMGCRPDDNDCDSDELPYHEVTLGAFEIDESEVTQGAYE